MTSVNGTTNIDDLPGPGPLQNVGSTQPFLGKQPTTTTNNNNGNIKLEMIDRNATNIKEQPALLSGNNTVEMNKQLEQSGIEMNQFVSGIQRASSDGVLTLPQRDIPISQNHITQDQQIQANYIPPNYQQGDYIKEHISKDEILRRDAMNRSFLQSQDDLYNELQLPLLIFILYFIFNLPFVRKTNFIFGR